MFDAYFIIWAVLGLAGYKSMVATISKQYDHEFVRHPLLPIGAAIISLMGIVSLTVAFYIG